MLVLLLYDYQTPFNLCKILYPVISTLIPTTSVSRFTKFSSPHEQSQFMTSIYLTPKRSPEFQTVNTTVNAGSSPPPLTHI